MPEQRREVRKLGILLPPGGELCWRLRARALAAAAVAAGWRAEVGLTGSDPAAPIPATLLEPFVGLHGVGTRRLAWHRTSAPLAREIYGAALVPEGVEAVDLPFDWGWHFADCDAWLLCSDGTLGLVPLVKPALLYCRGLAMRVAPGRGIADMAALTDAFTGFRLAPLALAADQATAADLASFAGLRRERIRTMPPLLAAHRGTHSVPGAGPLLLWWLAAGEAPGALALSALPWLLDAVPTLRIAVTGPGAAALAPPAALPWADPRLRLLPETTEAALLRLAASASAVWSDDVVAPEAEPAWLAACGAGRLVARPLPELRAAAAEHGLATHWVEPALAADAPGLAALLAEAVSAGPQPCARPAPAPWPLGALLEEVLAHAA
jgi:hypothetical protein